MITASRAREIAGVDVVPRALEIAEQGTKNDG